MYCTFVSKMVDWSHFCAILKFGAILSTFPLGFGDMSNHWGQQWPTFVACHSEPKLSKCEIVNDPLPIKPDSEISVFGRNLNFWNMLKWKRIKEYSIPSFDYQRLMRW